MEKSKAISYQDVYKRLLYMTDVHVDYCKDLKTAERRYEEVVKAYKVLNDTLKKYEIKMELKKPFLQKLYELKGAV